MRVLLFMTCALVLSFAAYMAHVDQERLAAMPEARRIARECRVGIYNTPQNYAACIIVCNNRLPDSTSQSECRLQVNKEFDL